MDYMLKSSDERVVINDFIQGDPLSEENLDKTLELVSNLRRVNSANPCKMGISEAENPDEIRLSFPNKSIWLYSGFRWEECQPFNEDGLLKPDKFAPNLQKILHKRYEVISMCNVMVDGRYIDSQRNPSKKFAGSDSPERTGLRQLLLHLKCP